MKVFVAAIMAALSAGRADRDAYALDVDAMSANAASAATCVTISSCFAIRAAPEPLFACGGTTTRQILASSDRIERKRAPLRGDPRTRIMKNRRDLLKDGTPSIAEPTQARLCNRRSA
jgi:hypothetical protein